MEAKPFVPPEDEDLTFLLGMAYHAWEKGSKLVGIDPGVLIYLLTGDLPPPVPDKAMEA